MISCDELGTGPFRQLDGRAVESQDDADRVLAKSCRTILECWGAHRSDLRLSCLARPMDLSGCHAFSSASGR